MTTVTISTGGPRPSAEKFETMRTRVDAELLTYLAAACGHASAFEGVVGAHPSRTSDRLGEVDAALASVPTTTPRASALVDQHGDPSAAALLLLQIWQGARLAIELEMLVQLDRGRVRMRSWHRALGRHVVSLSTADGEVFEVAWLAIDDWWLELARVVHISPGELGAEHLRVAFPAVIETPWELLVATGEAVARGKQHLVDHLVQDCSGPTAGGSEPGALEVATPDDVRSWHLALEEMSLGRLHAVVTGIGEQGHRGAGVVEWVLFADGWRSLTPCHRDGWHSVRIESRSVTDLSRDLAVLAAGVAA